ncbi:hypothetical protein [Adhaeribacter aquaticus]|uniref:hypothetical protein n=1 Tax=Adhaeribacter aquaticus TaxID=299567 RepID=UPI00040F810F|nr:hypothetical protein [Adhaeribacter aquaticus]
MEKTIQATPTEYKGIIFRSKTEAILARCWDIFNEQNDSNITVHYEYEPKSLLLPDGYVPDFAVTTWYGDIKKSILMIIELKPCAVTETYKRKLGKRFDAILSIMGQSRIPMGFLQEVRMELFTCNFFEDNHINTSQVYQNGRFSAPHELRSGELDCIQQAKSYRFDLQPKINQISNEPKFEIPKPIKETKGVKTMVKLPSLASIIPKASEESAKTPPVTNIEEVKKRTVKMPSLKDIKAIASKKH